ncbi:MAG: hypothetical protein JXJ20_00855 [Anaerolineae bacterium]|jgi:hypothetical protein|nr:hypothetical protein [Anaerolineae bacterium]
MDTQVTVRKGYVSGDFLTATYRISGEAALRGAMLLDQLNDQTLFVTLERIYISPLIDPVTLTGNYQTGNVRKDSLGLVILKQERDGLPRREGQYMGHNHVDSSVLIVAAGFEIKGAIRLHPSVDLENFIRTTPEHFIPLFNASATLTAHRGVEFQGGAILLNRNLIEVFCIED